MVDTITAMVAGFRAFRARYYEQRPDRMLQLTTHGQSPNVLVIACSDSRADPALLFGAEPGDMFTVRNVANLVPPYTPGIAHAGTSSALEYAVRDLKVKHIVVLGHSACGGVQALRDAMTSGTLPERDFIAPWMKMAVAACGNGRGEDVPDQQTVEHEAIRISLNNLRSFPWVSERVDAGELVLHGWWVDLAQGHLCKIDPDGGSVVVEPAHMEAQSVAD